jgi:hypothetical protein
LAASNSRTSVQRMRSPARRRLARQLTGRQPNFPPLLTASFDKSFAGPAWGSSRCHRNSSRHPAEAEMSRTSYMGVWIPTPACKGYPRTSKR